MKSSSFQFSDPVLTRLQFNAGEGTPKHDSDSEDIEVIAKISFSINIGRSKDKPKASIELGVELSLVDSDDSTLYTLSAAVGAGFRWSEEHDIERLDSLLTINAPALLLSYLRPVVANITNCSQYPVFNLPFVNFYDNESVSVIDATVD